MIAVLGASGRVGRHVAAGLADAGVPARALVRYPDRVDLPIPAVHADLRRPATLPDALRARSVRPRIRHQGPGPACQPDQIQAAAQQHGLDLLDQIGGDTHWCPGGARKLLARQGLRQRTALSLAAATH